jgi:hypothetical protein
MKSSPYFVTKKYGVKNVTILLSVVLMSVANYSVADSISYSPDQWPRHWNVLINDNQQNAFNRYGIPQNNYYPAQQNNYTGGEPARSPMWGMMPEVKQSHRRSRTPEYDTRYHVGNYFNQGNVYSSPYPNTMLPGLNNYGLNNYGLNTPYYSSVPGYYSAPFMSPGLAAPGLPFGVAPLTAFPYSGLYSPFGVGPGLGGLW